MSERILLGATLPQFTDDPRRFKEGVRRAEAAGLDSIWVFDHLWPLSGSKKRPILEQWTSLAWAAEATDSIRIGTLVTRSSLRNARLLAHMVQTVSDIAGDRLIVGIGSGDHKSRDENEAFGIPYWGGDERIQQLEDTVVLLRDHLPIGARLWVGGRSDDALSLAARYADGWNGWGGSPAAFASDAATVASLAGRRAVEPTWGGVIRESGAPAVARRLSAYVEAGARHLVCTFPEAWRPDLYEDLGAEVKQLIQSGR